MDIFRKKCCEIRNIVLANFWVPDIASSNAIIGAGPNMTKILTNPVDPVVGSLGAVVSLFSLGRRKLSLSSKLCILVKKS